MSMLENLKPLNDGIVVQLIENTQKVGMLFVPQISVDRSRRGVVVQTGPGRRLEDGTRVPIDVTVGDIVRFSMNDYEDGAFTLIKEGDILYKERR